MGKLYFGNFGIVLVAGSEEESSDQVSSEGFVGCHLSAGYAGIKGRETQKER